MMRIKGWIFDIQGEKCPVDMEIPEEYKEKPEKYFNTLCKNTNDFVSVGGYKGFLIGLVEV